MKMPPDHPLVTQIRMKLHYLQCKQFQFVVTLDEQRFRQLSKYFSGKGDSAPNKQEPRYRRDNRAMRPI